MKQHDPLEELEITGWHQPEGKAFLSVYGWVRFSEWLRCEAARLAKAGIATEVIGPNQYGEVCLRRKEAPLCNAM